MSTLRIGSLCSGYGGLDQGVQAAIGGRTVWVSDIDKGANKILAHRYPDVPNLGDFTTTDWRGVERIDVLTAGFPCQPVSHAGKRLGDNDERWLWDDVARAVGALRPGLVVLENVRGLLTAGSGRLFGRVLGTLAELGYDAQWHGLRAAEVGAPHGRWRVFIVAADTRRLQRGEGWPAIAGEAEGGRALGDSGRRDLLPTPRATRGGSATETVTLLPTPTVQDGANTGGPSRFERNTRPLNTEVLLLPTPAVNDMGAAYTPDEWDVWTERMKAEHGNGNGHGKSLNIEAQRLLPTPRTANNENRQSAGYGGADGNFHGLLTGASQWGDYAAAISRWEHVLGRPAPAPTMSSSKGNPQLAPAFVEWMMGLAAGWVTDVPGITRNEALKALGNGVVPQQAASALRLILGEQVAA